MKNASRIALLSVVAALVLAGCVRVQFDVTVADDNTVDGSIVLAIQKGIGESLGMSDDELIAEISSGDEPDFPGTKVDDYAEDEYVGKKYTFTDVPIAEFSGEDSGLTITRDGDFFIVDGDSPAAEVPEDEAGALAGAELTFTMTFPGDVVEASDGAVIDGNTVTFDVSDPNAAIHAKAKATAGGTPSWLLIAVSALIFLGLIAVVAVIAVRSRNKSVAAAAAPTEAVAAPAEPPVVSFDPTPAETAVVDEPVVDAAVEPAIVEPAAPDDAADPKES